MTRFLISLLGTVLFVTACGGGTTMLLNYEQRRYVQKNDISGKDSTYIMEKRIYEGMPVQHARAALGRPHKIDTTTSSSRTELTLTYRAQPKPGGGHLQRAYVYAVDDTVTRWKDLDRIPRFKSYYRPGN